MIEIVAAVVSYLFFLLLVHLNCEDKLPLGTVRTPKGEKMSAPTFYMHFRYKRSRDSERVSFFRPSRFRIDVALNNEVKVDFNLKSR